MPRMRVLVVLAALLTVLVGCGSSGPEPGVAPSGARSESPATTHDDGSGSPRDVYAFTGTTVDGATFDGADLAGEPAVLWFWAPWCPTCRAQTPTVEEIASQHSGEVAVVGIGGLDTAQAIKDYAAGVDEDVVILSDPDGAIWRHFGITAQSTYVILDADGQVVAEGYLDNGELKDRVAALAE